MSTFYLYLRLDFANEFIINFFKDKETKKNPIPQAVYLISVRFIQVNSQFKILKMKELKQHLNCVFLAKNFLGRFCSSGTQ